MALLHDSVISKKMDVRIIERNMARGLLSADEVEKALESLPDESQNAHWVEIDALNRDLSDFESQADTAYSHFN